MSSWVASGRTSLRLSSSVPGNRKTFWDIFVTWPRTEKQSIWLMSVPSTYTSPSDTPYSFMMMSNMVLLPLPEAPTIPVHFPFSKEMLRPCRIGSVSLYPNVQFRNSIFAASSKGLLPFSFSRSPSSSRYEKTFLYSFSFFFLSTTVRRMKFTFA